MRLLRRGHRDDTDLPGTGAAQDQAPLIGDGPCQVRSVLGSRVLSILIATCLVAAPVGAITGVRAMLDQGPVVVAPPQDQAGPGRGEQDHRQQVAEEFATRVVVIWLTTTADNLDPLRTVLPSATTTVTAPQQAYQAWLPQVAGSVPASEGVWSVTIGVTVTDALGQTARRYYQVPVSVAPGGAVSALTLPAMVPAPVIATSGGSGYAATLTSDDPARGTAAGFLAALLTGAGDVAPYLSATTSLAAIDPPPFTQLQVLDMRAAQAPSPSPADGEQVHVLATVTGTTSPAQQSTLTYALALSARDGRWQVSGIDPAPTPST